MRRLSFLVAPGAIAGLLLTSSVARGQSEPPSPDKTPEKTAETEAPRQDLVPRPAEPPPSPKVRFTADPVGDTGVTVLAVTFTLLSSEVLSTGEIRPQQISPTFRSSSLLKIDRGAISQTIDSRAGTLSNLGVIAAVTYAAVDTVVDIWREGRTSALVDFVMYAEAASITQGITNLAKVAFRRPRPKAYIQRNRYLASGGDPSLYDNSDTDSALSFFSGHSSAAASLGAAATYIAFSRAPGTARPWLTLGGSVALTSFVAYERVRAGAHFPTDVFAGALAGTAVGALVVHLHREDSVRQRPVWIGVTPEPGGGVLGASGLF